MRLTSSTWLAFLALSAPAIAVIDNPKLVLPWGTWEGQPLADEDNIILFKNVRFGAEPERFSTPSFPTSSDNTVYKSFGQESLSCIQIDRTAAEHPPGGDNPIGEDPNGTQTEDCLFLDLYVPKSALAGGPSTPSLPVVVWIYGGAYAFGSKDQEGPLYTGRALLRAAQYKTIFVVGNYRVGAFGWLAGHYMEQVGQPNAGLYDQALLLQWVQQYIHLANGDPKPFQTFFAQSPAFEWAWDNSPGGRLDHIFSQFSKLAGCEGDYDIDCLRTASIETLRRANQDLFDAVRQTGLFPVGPAVDGKWIKSIPAVTLSQNKVWKGVGPSIISHCENEAYSFTPKNVNSQASFDKFLETFLPGTALAPERLAIRQRYNCTEPPSNGDYNNCLRLVIQDGFFTCNTRNLFDAYPSSSRMISYGFPTSGYAYHAADLIPLFMNNADEAKALLIKIGISSFFAGLYAASLNQTVAPVYQNCLASFAATGDPNANLGGLDPPPGVASWSTADGSTDALSGVLQVRAAAGQEPYVLISDSQNTKNTCAFWTGIAKDIVSGSAQHDEL
ncbi:carboxylesterase family protein [Dichotomopilus funicola]|uniref:Carboxylesterase family protein n=1 Tax=Dichotomopilus funicola TaxID=1934379 RepID=A0AAN6V824_9PEZI|nr:carboxylesterase family protein [Dichotomopilus funicola]